MARQTFGQPYLLVPAKVFLRVMRELNVIGRIRIDKVTGLQWELFEIPTRKLPLREGRDVLSKIRFVGNLFVSAKRNVEFAAAIEPA
ncbi:MAG: hypothetical protein WBQ86_16195 [Candidatus Binatus sp.]